MSLTMGPTLLPPGQMLPLYLGANGLGVPTDILDKVSDGDLEPQFRTLYELDVGDKDTLDRVLMSPLSARDTAFPKPVHVSDSANLDLLKVAVSLFNKDHAFSFDYAIAAVRGSPEILQYFKEGANVFFSKHPANKEITDVVFGGLKRTARRLALVKSHLSPQKYIQLGAHLSSLFSLKAATFAQYGFSPEILADPVLFVSAYKKGDKIFRQELVANMGLKSPSDFESYFNMSPRQWSGILVLVMNDLQSSDPFMNRATSLREYVDYLILNQFIGLKLKNIDTDMPDEKLLEAFENWAENMKAWYGWVPQNISPGLFLSIIEPYLRKNRYLLALVAGFLSPLEAYASNNRVTLDLAQFKRGMALRVIVDHRHLLGPLPVALGFATLTIYSLNLHARVNAPDMEDIPSTLDKDTQEWVLGGTLLTYLAGCSYLFFNGNRLHLNQKNLDFPVQAGSRNMSTWLISLGVSTTFGKVLSDTIAYSPNMSAILLTTAGMGMYYWHIYQQAIYEEKVLLAKFGSLFKRIKERTNRFWPKIPKGLFSGFFGGQNHSKENPDDPDR